jgi:hypothetical protein
MAARRFKKKPVVVGAIQWTGDNFQEILNWASDENLYLHEGQLYIYTLEGTMLADVEDWIIQGVQGEFYPCKPGIFAESYEEVIEDEDGFPDEG